MKFRKATYKELHRLLFAYIFISITLVFILYSKTKTIETHSDAIVYDAMIDKISQAIYPNNTRIINISEDIKRECRFGEFFNKDCVAYKLRNLNITYVNLSKGKIPSINETLTKGGDCKGFAIVYASVLKNLNMETYLVLQDEHICTMFRKGTEAKLLYCFWDKPIKFIKKV